MPPLRIYIDTSVVGGVFDDGFEVGSKRIFEAASHSKISLLISDVLLDELDGAPRNIADFLDAIPLSQKEFLESRPETDTLLAAYLERDIVSPKYVDDARHVAAATVACADAIVSWNFKHLVNPHRIAKFNLVNSELGYNPIRIISPDSLEI